MKNIQMYKISRICLINSLLYLCVYFKRTKIQDIAYSELNSTK